MNLTHALGLAAKYHAGQKYGDEDYFDYHILNVLSRVQFNYREHEKINDLRIVAVLHDIKEDHPECAGDLEVFNKDIQEAIESISFKKGKESRKEYYERVKQNELARLVKIQDALENQYNCLKNREYKRSLYYTDIACILEENK